MKPISETNRKIPVFAYYILLVLFLIPFERMYDRILRPFFYHHTDLPKQVVKSLYFYASDVLILLVTLALLAVYRFDLKTLLWNKNVKYLTVLIALCFLSLLNSPVPTTLMNWSRACYLFLSFLLAGSILLIFNKETPRAFLKPLFVCVLSLALFECFVGITQYFTQGALGLRILNEQKLNSGNLEKSIIAMHDSTRWILDGILTHHKKQTTTLMRAYGTFPHPNVFGGFLFFSLLCTYGLYFLSSKKLQKGFLSLAIFAQVFALFITYSRSALFAWIGSSCLWVILLMAAGIQERNLREVWARIRPIFLSIAISLTLCLILFYPQLYSRGGVVNYNAFAKTSDSTRIVAQDISLQMIKKFPWLGSGYFNYDKAVAKFSSVPFAMPHNIYLLIADEMGLMALAAFLFFILSTIRCGFQNRKDPMTAALLAIFIGFLFIGCCDFYLIFFQNGKLLFFLTAGLIGASFREKRSESLAMATA